ncbi:MULTISPECIES: winged helix-turn-helix domain-containing protein [unclassified Rathayibacter]|uniref:winged helix-turn-helix domain-containing protein n=1 Tax=unclassified Rathayibacter TaxID=2609250 RepID=UPI000CE84BAD|nr:MULTISPECIES: winged helix-turn-helix domain-containing protein [unclassified Rathayibacter]PPI41292.1 ArsR family transcriptional regulator [Rathayibacter sp. RFBD1]PPI62465.1 ArsR family transcriptional regulator [Rathayibacter sp. TRS19]
MVDRSNLHDAAHMRVLAHPTRLRLLGLLRELGPRTAAQLSEHIDEAPGTLSYHLTKLAGAGLIEEAPESGRDRRERWWRAKHLETVWDESEVARDPEKLGALREMAAAISRVYAQQYDEYLASTPTLPEEWVSAGTSSDRRWRLSADQLWELRDELAQLDRKWARVSDDHRTDDGSEEVFFLVQAYRRPR